MRFESRVRSDARVLHGGNKYADEINKFELSVAICVVHVEGFRRSDLERCGSEGWFGRRERTERRRYGGSRKRDARSARLWRARAYLNSRVTCRTRIRKVYAEPRAGDPREKSTIGALFHVSAVTSPSRFLSN